MSGDMDHNDCWRENTGPAQSDDRDQVMADKPTYEELEILAKRNYHGLKPAGHCSRHHPKGKVAFDCGICFPNYNALCGEHNELKQKAWAALNDKDEEIADLRRFIALMAKIGARDFALVSVEEFEEATELRKKLKV